MITNLVNGKKYVGQTITTIEERWYHHKWESIKDAGNSLDINPSTITSCCMGRYVTAGGFIWGYR